MGAGTNRPDWPRFNRRTGAGGDADRNEMGCSGYGCDCLLWTAARGGPLRMGQPSGLD
jgi:hypothetical protein